MSKVLVKSAWGSDDPTKAAFPFLHANALAETGFYFEDPYGHLLEVMTVPETGS